MNTEPIQNWSTQIILSLWSMNSQNMETWNSVHWMNNMTIIHIYNAWTDDNIVYQYYDDSSAI